MLVSHSFHFAVSHLFVEINHPVLEMMRRNFHCFIAEDIERCNALLSGSVARTSGRSEVIDCHIFILYVDRNYRMLGVMMKNNKNFTTEMSKYRSLNGFTNNSRRLNYDEKRR